MKYGIKKKDDSFGHELDSFRNRISDLFDDFFNLKPSTFFDTEWVPAMDVHEDKAAIYIKAEMPGINEKDIDVKVENKMLTIRGEKSEEKKEGNEKRTIITERKYGSFQRSIRIPDDVRIDAIKAEFKNGILNIEIPKSKVEEPRKIKIDIK